MITVSAHSLRFWDDCPINNISSTCCSMPNIGENQEYMVCYNCGTVLTRIYDNSSRRAFTTDEIARRKFTEPVYDQIGPRTVIRGNFDSRGNLISAQDQTKFTRLRKINRSLTTGYERNLRMALQNFQCLSDSLSLPDIVVKDAIRIYQEGVKLKLSIGRSNDALLASTIYVAFKIHSIPRMIEEIIGYMDLPKKTVMKCYRALLMQVLPKLNIRVPHMNSCRYVESFGEKLHLPMRVRRFAEKLIQKAKSNGLILEGKDPKGIAAAAIYLSTSYFQCPKTQKELAKLAHKTDFTLRERCRELKKFSIAPCISLLPSILTPVNPGAEEKEKNTL